MGLLLGGAGVGFLGPNEALNYLIKRRKKRVERALPNALDLMVVCVESGLGLDQAITQVSREMQKSGPEISNELAITNLEMRHGKRRAEALRNLGERTGVDDVKKLVSTLIQADRFGTSIAVTLRTALGVYARHGPPARRRKSGQDRHQAGVPDFFLYSAVAVCSDGRSRRRQDLRRADPDDDAVITSCDPTNQT